MKGNEQIEEAKEQIKEAPKKSNNMHNKNLIVGNDKSTAKSNELEMKKQKNK